MATSVERLEIALEQMLQALKKRGIQPSVDLTSMVREVRRDMDAVNRSAMQSTIQLNQLQELVRTSQLINSSLELDQVLEEVIDTVIHLTRAERAYLMLKEKDNDELEMRTMRNWDRETLSESEAVFSRGIVNKAISERQTILTTNAQDDARFQGMQSVFSHSLRSIVCIPLIVRDQVVGVLYADNRIGQGVFNPENVPILGAFANQAAIAIENARLFAQVRADLHAAEREVQELRIIIDERKKEMAVKEITQTQYFQDLESKVRMLRRRSSSAASKQSDHGNS